MASIFLGELNTFYKRAKKQDLAYWLLALINLSIFAINPTYLSSYLDPFLGTHTKKNFKKKKFEEILPLVPNLGEI